MNKLGYANAGGRSAGMREAHSGFHTTIVNESCVIRFQELPKHFGGFPAELEIAFSSTGRGERPLRACPGSPETAFSSTSKGKRRSRGARAGAQDHPKRNALGLPGHPLKLPFPRQAEGKGYCEHFRESRNCLFLDRQRGKAIARVPK